MGTGTPPREKKSAGIRLRVYLRIIKLTNETTTVRFRLILIFFRLTGD